jgi:hypothetical protein
VRPYTPIKLTTRSSRLCHGHGRLVPRPYSLQQENSPELSPRPFLTKFAGRLRDLRCKQPARHEGLHLHHPAIVPFRKNYRRAFLEFLNDVGGAFLGRDSENALSWNGAAFDAGCLIKLRRTVKRASLAGNSRRRTQASSLLYAGKILRACGKTA